MKRSVRMTALGVAACLGLTIAAPIAAEAGSKGRQNTALVLGAAAAYGVVKKNPTIAGVAGAGAIYSYVRSRQAASKERNRSRSRQRRRRLARSHYYQPVSYHRHSSSCGHRSSPPRWSRGKKTGWGGGHVPPGHAKKGYKH